MVFGHIVIIFGNTKVITGYDKWANSKGVTLNRMLRVTSTSEPTVNSRVVSFCLKVFSFKLALFCS